MLGAFDTMGPEEVARAEADVRSFETAAALARQEWEREQELFDREISARATADAARDRHRLAEAQLEAARRHAVRVRS